jgi:hypothetical protein
MIKIVIIISAVPYNVFSEEIDIGSLVIKRNTSPPPPPPPISKASSNSTGVAVSAE